MRTQSDRPADTRMMGIVHDALRRDLSRATTVLTSTPPPPDQQRVAIATHVRWLMDFLHAHHAGEDEGLWPLVLGRNPAAYDLLDQMDADHARIGPQIELVQNAAATCGTDASPGARRGLAAAIESLRSELDPHLCREEDEMMPVVSRSITQAQWEAFNTTTYLQSKSKKELGHEGHWLIDSLDHDRYDVVVHTVPTLARFILVHAFARPYRQECAARWGPDVQVKPLRQQVPSTGDHDPDLLDGRYRRRGQVSLYVEASPKDLYDVVADVTRVAERSPECHKARWLPGSPPRVVGARFRGYNRKGLIRWSRVCEVVIAEVGSEFAYQTIPERVDLSRRDSTTWTYRFSPEATGTRVSHSYDVTLPPLRPFLALYKRVMPQHSDMRPAMTENLTALKQIAEHNAAPRSST